MHFLRVAKQLYYLGHGTGTRTGDAIEIQAINDCFSWCRNRPLPVGSVKAVFGHNEECAGMTGKDWTPDGNQTSLTTKRLT